MSAIGDFFNKILSVFSTFGISDALDILFVAVIIMAVFALFVKRGQCSWLRASCCCW